jgi:LmbE family N-acetylglucosaminyl deacetylase
MDWDSMGDTGLRLLCVLAHPDDESMATGGLLARYAAEGVATYVLCATRGERGWRGDPDKYPGPTALGRVREAELRAAANMLGLRNVMFMDYLDGELDQAEPAEATERIVAALRLVRPQVVVTFDPLGLYGHPDHIAIAQLTTAAVVAAADPDYPCDAYAPAHRVDKLYYLAAAHDLIDAFNAAFGELRMEVGGQTRSALGWPDWGISARIEAYAHWRTAWRAVACHRSQLPEYERLAALPDELHARLWGAQTFYRAMSLVNGGRAAEDDLFAGLRSTAEAPLAVGYYEALAH